MRAGTFRWVARRGATHLDARRRLLPRDYLEDPWRFGRDLHARWRLPEGGDPVSMRVAQLQHEIVVAWGRRGRQPSTAELCERYGMSKQVVSRVALGERWAGETVLAALVDAISTTIRSA